MRTGLRQLTDGGSSFGGDVQPSFYPSGQRVVFARLGDIFSVGIDGTGLRRITASYADEHAPVVSLNGRQIVFECANYKRKGIEYSNEHICSIRPDGSHRRDLTPRLQGGQEAFDPDFSPSGRVIAFSVGPGFAADIFTMRANGARLGALTNRGPRGGRKFPRDVGYNEPAFSPEGDSIIAVARSGERPRFAASGSPTPSILSPSTSSSWAGCPSGLRWASGAPRPLPATARARARCR